MPAFPKTTKARSRPQQSRRGMFRTAQTQVRRTACPRATPRRAGSPRPAPSAPRANAWAECHHGPVGYWDKCQSSGCERRVRARGYRKAHYERLKDGAHDMAVAARERRARRPRPASARVRAPPVRGAPGRNRLVAAARPGLPVAGHHVGRRRLPHRQESRHRRGQAAVGRGLRGRAGVGPLVRLQVGARPAAASLLGAPRARFRGLPRARTKRQTHRQGAARRSLRPLRVVA